MTSVNLDALKSLQLKLSFHEAFLIEDPIDLFYLLKKPLSLGSILIEKDCITVFVDGRYLAACSHLEGVKTLPSEHGGFEKYLKTSHVKSIYFDSDKTSFSHYEKLVKLTDFTFIPKKQILRFLRIKKTEAEIKLIEASTKLLADVYQEFLLLPKVGLSEKQIATQFKILSLEKGAEDFSFEPIIAIGENGAYPHHRPQDRILNPSDVMLVDIGLTKNQYQSDMTRMVFFGHADKELLRMHDMVLEAHQAALALCRPGIALGLLDQAARDVFKKYNVEHLFCHSLGHGLGLETHEAPRLKNDGIDKDVLLEEGMVITIEPGLYKEGLGGIRHEDLIVITESGYRNFYPDFF